jgi:hypothetical protein
MQNVLLCVVAWLVGTVTLVGFFLVRRAVSQGRRRKALWTELKKGGEVLREQKRLREEQHQAALREADRVRNFLPNLIRQKRLSQQGMIDAGRACQLNMNIGGEPLPTGAVCKDERGSKPTLWTRAAPLNRAQAIEQAWMRG